MAKGRLHAHAFHATGTLRFFTPERAPLARHELDRRVALLAFAALQPTRRPYLDAGKLHASVGSIAAAAGTSPLAWRPAYLHRVSAAEPLRLSLVHVGTTRSLRAAITDLERFVSSRAFLPWWYFASVDGFVLTYLHRGSRAEADELGRWLRRRPLLSRLRETPVPIPVYVYPARTPAELAGVGVGSKKDKTPSGVSSHPRPERSRQKPVPGSVRRPNHKRG